MLPANPRATAIVTAALLAASCGWSLAWACGFDDTLREYLSAPFWLPFVKHPRDFAAGPKLARRPSAPFAGMDATPSEKPIGRLRRAYRTLNEQTPDGIAKQLAALRADASLTAREREEVDLIDAKFDLRWGEGGEEIRGNAKLLDTAFGKLQSFLRRARTPEYLSEARGWIARIHFLRDEQSAAGKIYLDELRRPDSNLSDATLLNSLRLTYDYSGGSELVKHLDEYFDTPEHAAFAIQLVTNPEWDRQGPTQLVGPRQPAPIPAIPYARIAALLEQHRELFKTPPGARLLALLGMRTALRAGDPRAALRIASAVSARDPIRGEADFLWMLASAQFLSRNFAAAEAPLLRLWRLPSASEDQQAAATYALCGVYQKLKNPVEQLRYALRLKSEGLSRQIDYGRGGAIEDQSVYWMISGWDFGLLVDAEASIATLQAFLARYPNAAGIGLVQYALAVRLAREDRYEESAQLYEAANARTRATRMRQAEALHREAATSGIAEAKYKWAEFLSSNSERVYFNDQLWGGLQRYALEGESDARLTLAERRKLIQDERTLKDSQEELWRAHLILREVVSEAGKTDLGRRAARLAIQCLRRINSERFGRAEEIRKADIELSLWLGRS